MQNVVSISGLKMKNQVGELVLRQFRIHSAKDGIDKPSGRSLQHHLLRED